MYLCRDLLRPDSDACVSVVVSESEGKSRECAAIDHALGGTDNVIHLLRRQLHRGAATLQLTWRLQMNLAIGLYIGLVFLPESARWLAKDDK